MATCAFLPPLYKGMICSDRTVKDITFFYHKYNNLFSSRSSMMSAEKRREDRLVFQRAPPCSPMCTHSVRGRSQKQSGDTSSSASTHYILSLINDATKWVVSAVVFLILLLKRDEATAWCVVGGIVAAFICRALKFAINASRPPQSKKVDPGMPSSHACTLGFLSVFASVVMLDASVHTIFAASLPILGLFLTYLRVLLGYHTFPQVMVGWMLGSTIAVAWHSAGNLLLPHMMANRAGRVGLALVTGVLVGMFALKNVMRWRHE